MANNRLGSLDYNTISHNTALTSLDINQNRITDIDNPTFQENKILSILKMSNRLNYLQDQMIPHNLELQIIDFGINLIPVSPQKFFVGNTELRSINLRANNITQISPGTFHTNKNITDLHLSHNKIQELNDNVFAETQIKTLNLRGNDLTMRGNVLLLKAPLLVKLDLGMCGITALPPKTFQGLLHLKELLLDNNSLSVLTEAEQKNTVFTKLYRLTKLDLSSNNITEINSNFLYGMQNLVVINL
jgi:Leucine-rich repeat (LRR) protein